MTIYSLSNITTKYNDIIITDEFSNCEIYIKINQPLNETDEFYYLYQVFIENSALGEDELTVKTTIFSILTIIGIIALAILSKSKYIDEKLKKAMEEITEAYYSICQSRKFIAEHFLLNNSFNFQND